MAVHETENLVIQCFRKVVIAATHKMIQKQSLQNSRKEVLLKEGCNYEIEKSLRIKPLVGTGEGEG